MVVIISFLELEFFGIEKVTFLRILGNRLNEEIMRSLFLIAQLRACSYGVQTSGYHGRSLILFPA